jgi:CRISPR system Cascade subunit CasD
MRPNPKARMDRHTVSYDRYEAEHETTRTVQVYQDFLYDAEFSVLVWESERAQIPLDAIAEALAKPVGGPYLGRRCCVPCDNYFRGFVEADDVFSALQQIEPAEGMVLTDFRPEKFTRELKIRDVPLYCGKLPAKGTRSVWVSLQTRKAEEKGVADLETF